MNQDKAIATIENIDSRMLEIFRSKSADYADQDPLSNFKIVSEVIKLLKIDTTTPEGYALLMVVLKICRIGNLLSAGKTPNNESIEDSFMDGINYFKLALLCYKDKPKPVSDLPSIVGMTALEATNAMRVHFGYPPLESLT